MKPRVTVDLQPDGSHYDIVVRDGVLCHQLPGKGDVKMVDNENGTVALWREQRIRVSLPITRRGLISLWNEMSPRARAHLAITAMEANDVMGLLEHFACWPAPAVRAFFNDDCSGHLLLRGSYPYEGESYPVNTMIGDKVLRYLKSLYDPKCNLRRRSGMLVVVDQGEEASKS